MYAHALSPQIHGDHSPMHMITLPLDVHAHANHTHPPARTYTHTSNTHSLSFMVESCTSKALREHIAGVGDGRGGCAMRCLGAYMLAEYMLALNPKPWTRKHKL